MNWRACACLVLALLGGWLLARRGDAATLAAAAEGLAGIALVDKPASVSALFGRYRRYASAWLLAAAALIAPLFGWRYGRSAVPALIAPPLLGIGICLAVLGYLGQALTLSHWMALMLVLGVGANYAVFPREAEPYAAMHPGAAYAGVLLSALTALLSFGLLAFSSMPALRHRPDPGAGHRRHRAAGAAQPCPRHSLLMNPRKPMSIPPSYPLLREATP